MSHFHKKIKTAVGELTLVASETHLVAVLWEDDRPGRVRLPKSVLVPDHPILRSTEKQLREYFDRQRSRFELPLDLAGTAFQCKVWRELLKIPFGNTRSYGELAAQIGSPKASRAVGAANGRNPLSIVVPCHRVIGANGSLTGFAGGMRAKSFLLNLERSGHCTAISRFSKGKDRVKENVIREPLPLCRRRSGGLSS